MTVDYRGIVDVNFTMNIQLNPELIVQGCIGEEADMMIRLIVVVACTALSIIRTSKYV